MKRISILLALILIFSTCFSVTNILADGLTIALNEAKLLEGVGIKITDSSAPVTRAEFAKYLALAAGNRVFVDVNGEGVFSDASAKNERNAYINAVYNAGLMNGVSGDRFGVEMEISGTDAVVALVRLAGYENIALYSGGYPSGYMAVAQQKNMLKGVSLSGDPISRTALLKLLYNTLHTDVYQIGEVGSLVEYKSIEGDDVLKIYHDIFKTSGVVTANRFTSLSKATSSCDANEIEIDKVLYKCNSESDSDYIGMKVSAYYKKLESDVIGTLVCVHPNEYKNDVISLKYEDMGSVNGYTLTFYDENKDMQAQIQPGFSCIYNGRYYADATMSDLISSDSEVKLIDADANGKYETAIVSRAETMIVTGVDRSEYIIYGENENVVRFNRGFQNSFLCIYTDEGEELYFDRVKQGDVISVYASKDDACINVYVSGRTVEGTVVEKAAGESVVTLLIDDEKVQYEVARGYISDFEINLQGKFYLDVYNRLVYSDKEPGSDYTYGYLINGVFDGTFSPAKLLILTSVDFEEYVCSKNIFIDGVKSSFGKSSVNAVYDGTNFKPQVVRFYYTGKNEITHIDTTASGNGDKASDRLAFSKNVTGVYEETFANFGNACAIGDRTLFIKAPTSGELIYNRDYYAADHSFLRANTSYTVSTYDMDENLTPQVIVYNSNEITVSGALNDYSTQGVVMDKFTALNTDGEAVQAIRIFTRDGEKVTCFFDDTKYPLDKSMEFGDVILFVADANKNIMKWSYDFDYSAGDVSSNTSSYNTYFTKYVGYPYSKGDKSFTFLNKKNNPNLEEDWEHLFVFPTDVMKFIEIDMKGKEVTATSYAYVNSFKHYKEPKNFAFVKVYRGGGLYIDAMYMYKH